ncbi:4Fe-4S binding protein [Pelagicoccus sp. NFK12]|uniref:4Fe-4S binding protein n=1 Tax=Pelagicoccus enzymogenes TaxID=2773457 RepID=A0A927FAJ7_9BACT|nr:4Fe-4S binding protein [Pelagicoccus enzymogenes]MBD5780850.1 4Fe-4S binding protein [Pelagicoccus enzymogenes]MDQ8199884.1 4Fe-4S binding protein [Pelagicoccus enzymogenes]
MSDGKRQFSRRDFFSNFLKHVREDAEQRTEGGRDRPSAEPKYRTAVIQGRYCLAYQNNFCSVCSERCPEEGAIVTERGIPRVDADACTGCGICHDLCPAPRNAILLLD